MQKSPHILLQSSSLSSHMSIAFFTLVLLVPSQDHQSVSENNNRDPLSILSMALMIKADNIVIYNISPLIICCIF